MGHLELRGLTKRYGSLVAVHDLTMDVPPGRVTGFVGANGAGKSTTIRMLLGLTRPTAGTATIDGHAYADLADPIRTVGAVVDPGVFHPARTGRDSLRVLARAARIEQRRVDDVLELVGLTDSARRRTKGYSTGMRQRLALAAALLGDPPTLVLDEPGNGLDPQGIHWLRELLRGMATEGRTVLVSSHQLAELAQVVDEVAVIDHGRLLAHQPIAALTAGGRRLEDAYLALTQPPTPEELP
jgi:ABC-2 type transport system ATP-binding protein